MEFVPVFGTTPDLSALSGSTLVLPTFSAGMSPMIAVDLFLLNEKPDKLGYIKSDMIAPLVQMGTLAQAGEAPTLQMPCELFLSKDRRYTFLVLRSGVVEGKMRAFGDALAEFVAASKFKRVHILTSTFSPVKRERDSNRLLPEIFCYTNNFVHKQEGASYYDEFKIRKFGYWLGDKKIKPHQEMQELAGAGSSNKLMMTFNRIDVPCVLFVIFTPGELDFVGGYTYYSFLKNKFDMNGNAQAPLGKVEFVGQPEIKTGEDIHEHLFVKKGCATPVHWANVLSYY